MLGWGAFIDVGNGHRGLLHVDEMKWPEGAMAPSAFDCVKEDQVLEVSLPCLLAICSVFFGCTSSHVHSLSGAACERVTREQVSLICIVACLEYRWDEQASCVRSRVGSELYVAQRLESMITPSVFVWRQGCKCIIELTRLLLKQKVHLMCISECHCKLRHALLWALLWTRNYRLQFLH